MPNKWCLNSGFEGINCIIKLSAIIRFVLLVFFLGFFSASVASLPFEQTNGERNNYRCPRINIYIKFTIIMELHTRDAHRLMIDGVDENETANQNERKKKQTWCWFCPIILISIVFRCMCVCEMNEKKTEKPIITLIAFACNLCSFSHSLGSQEIAVFIIL